MRTGLRSWTFDLQKGVAVAVAVGVGPLKARHLTLRNMIKQQAILDNTTAPFHSFKQKIGWVGIGYLSACMALYTSVMTCAGSFLDCIPKYHLGWDRIG